MSAGELLLEVRVEEIPARMLPGAVQELGTRLFEELMARSLPPAEIETGFTPRRLWLTMRGLPAQESDREVVEVGPPAAAAFDAAGKPTAAALGFAKKFGAEVSELKRRTFSGTPGLDKAEGGAGGGRGKSQGERVVLERRVAGRATREILAELIPAVLRGLSWAKTMRWGAGVGPWVRPVHGVVALLDSEVVPFELFGVEAGRTSAGHPTLSPEPFAVAGVDDWRAKLAALEIEPSPAARQERLRAEMSRRAAASGGALVDDPELLAKLAAICEIPGVMAGSFDAALLELPREVLATSLRDHQSALTVERDGVLLPHFLTVMDRPDDPAGRVRAGNEWVVAARLADAAFFWKKDRARPLAERAADLAGVAFHAKLGSYAAKSRRGAALARRIGEALALSAGELDELATAGALAKADLTTEMVREFTSLQGVMGGVYAREEGAPRRVWEAIYDQYLPAGSADALPRGTVGRALALADRLDTLVGFFALGQVPTGSKDPFGLRRAALGAMRLILESGLALPLRELVAQAHAELAAEVTLTHGADETWRLLRPFFDDRVRFLLELGGFAYDEIDAGLRRGEEELADLPALRARVAALHGARDDNDFLAVVLASKRIANITKGLDGAAAFDPERLEVAEERELHAAARELDSELEAALARRDFTAGLAAVSRLSPSLEAFFQKVLVMDPDEAKRTNRLALLSGLGASIGRLADLSQLVVDKADYR